MSSWCADRALTYGIACGGACGAGIAIGGWFQNTEANLHSGYSFAGAFEWLSLA